jgi:hypothetical protein
MNKGLIFIGILIAVFFISGCEDYYEEDTSTSDDEDTSISCEDWAKTKIPDTLNLNKVTEDLYGASVVYSYDEDFGLVLTDNVWNDGTLMIRQTNLSTFNVEKFVGVTFRCPKGENPGENINHIYCPYERFKYESEPIANEQGIVLGRNYFIIGNLEFKETENEDRLEIIDYEFVNDICQVI